MKLLQFLLTNSVLFSIKQLMPSHHVIQKVQDWLLLLQSRRSIRVNFCWVPAHIGVEGNERADKAAKEASEQLNPSPVGVPFRDFKSVIHSYCMTKWQTRWSSLDTNAKLRSIHPTVGKWSSCNPTCRRDGIILTRLRIGHTHATHSFLMKSEEERQVPSCATCRVVLSIKHILVECPNFSPQRRLHTLQGRSLSELLGDQCDILNLMSFLRSIDFYHKF